MIFVAKGMNASDNNLGKLNIRSVNDISQETIDLLNYYGGEYNDEQKLGLDDFLLMFNGASWKSKVKVLVLPFLGVPLAEDIVLGPYGSSKVIFSRNIINDKICSPKSGIPNNAPYNSVNSGIAYTTDQKAGTTVVADNTVEEDITKVGVGAYGTICTGYGDVTYYRNNSIYITVNQQNSMPVPPDIFKNDSINHINLSNTMSAIVDNNVVASIPVTFTNWDSIPKGSNMKLELGSNGTSLKMYTVYVGMSDAEVIEFNKMLRVLFNTFGI